MLGPSQGQVPSSGDGSTTKHNASTARETGTNTCRRCLIGSSWLLRRSARGEQKKQERHMQSLRMSQVRLFGREAVVLNQAVSDFHTESDTSGGARRQQQPRRPRRCCLPLRTHTETREVGRCVSIRCKNRCPRVC